ncbi:hypothetical protein MCOR03_007617 [Pyricularia oryzae]|nr:hypothetical protein MCOR01_008356 [Pyricularia oryzae]KAI6335005.1 hypothetical protein MCOR28_009846 [Pyricularia oryzae]KAI6358055.1 hypothetical protein MCOR32_009633 [Pyricularia oryzae]KAI6394781.1 hypothetical protein MCOR24_009479 [Pyricularia oryzae]KAI6399195.1 hypothetical protein MCOR20_008922 [Pyricularia oryzae]
MYHPHPTLTATTWLPIRNRESHTRFTSSPPQRTQDLSRLLQSEIVSQPCYPCTYLMEDSPLDILRPSVTRNGTPDLGQTPLQATSIQISRPRFNSESIQNVETCSSKTTNPGCEDELAATTDDEYILCTVEGNLARRPLLKNHRVFAEVPESAYGDNYIPWGYKALGKVRSESRHIWFSGDGFTRSEARPTGRFIGSKRKASDLTSAIGLLDLSGLSQNGSLDQNKPTANDNAFKRIRRTHVGSARDLNLNSTQSSRRKFERKSDANTGDGPVLPSNDPRRTVEGSSEYPSVISQTPQVSRLARSSSLPIVPMTPWDVSAAILKGAGAMNSAGQRGSTQKTWQTYELSDSE